MRPLRAVPAKGHTSFLVSTLYAQAQQPDAAKLKPIDSIDDLEAEFAL